VTTSSATNGRVPEFGRAITALVHTHVAFLRGMNVGGHRITNTALCDCFEGLGLQGSTAFLASGNVVFEAKGTEAALRSRIEEGLGEALGYAVPTFIRTRAQVQAIAKRDPFAGREGVDARGKPQVVFLARKPSAKAAATALALATDDDWLALEGRELRWLPCGRLSDSELDLAAIAKALGAPTIRTHNTVVRLVAKFFA